MIKTIFFRSDMLVGAFKTGNMWIQVEMIWNVLKLKNKTKYLPVSDDSGDSNFELIYKSFALIIKGISNVY